MVQTQRELLILTILLIPVRLIKWTYKAVSILIYLPNYLIIRLFDLILFNSSINNSFYLYCLFLLLRLALLILIGLGFVAQFHLLYLMLHLRGNSIYIQCIAMFFFINIVLLLMRKGYNYFIKMFDPTKLKSPIEHITLLWEYTLDLIGIIPMLLNLILIVRMHKTLRYEYSPNQRRFLSHITQQIRASLFIYIDIFYIKFFFRMFKWRYNASQQLILDSKDKLLKLYVVLTVLFYQTINDLLFIISIGWIPLLHIKRRVYLNNFDNEYRYWRVVLRFNFFIVIQIIQISLLLLCLVKAPSAWKMLKVVLSESSATDNHLLDILILLLESMILPIYIFSLVMIMLSGYKYDKYLSKLQKFPDSNPSATAIIYMLQLTLESILIIPIIIATLLKPYNYFWVKFIIRNDYDINLIYVSSYLFFTIVDIFWLFTTFCLSCFIALYHPNHLSTIFTIFKQAYNQRKLMKEWQIINSKSTLKKTTTYLFYNLSNDILNIPLYLVLKVSPLWLLGGSTPYSSPRDHQWIMKNLLQQWVRMRSKYYQSQYLSSYHKEHSQIIKTQNSQFEYWRMAAKCNRYEKLIQWLRFIISKRKVEKVEKKMTITKYEGVSWISNRYWNVYNHFWVLMNLLLYLIISTLLTIIGVVILMPLTLWRIPTFLILFAHRCQRIYFFAILWLVFKQMFLDVILIPFNFFAFVLSPFNYLKFKLQNAFYYGGEGKDSFKQTQISKNELLLSLIKQSLYRYLVTIMIIITFGAILRVKYYLRKIKQARKQQLQNSIDRSSLPRTTKLVLAPIMLRWVKINLGFLDFIKIPFIKHLPSVKQLKNKNTYLQQYIRNNTQNRKFQIIADQTKQIIPYVIMDIPFMIATAIMVVLVPWRIFYIFEIINQISEGVKDRVKFYKLARNVFKDYICVILNLILLLSIIKIKKVFQLALKNYRLNFFVGFLNYSYFQELLKQVKEAIRFYLNFVLLLLSCILNWINIHLIIQQLYQHYRHQVQISNQKIPKRKIIDNGGKNTNYFLSMGINCFMNVCEYLQTNEIVKLSYLSKVTYKMANKKQIWMDKWQTTYQQKHGTTNDDESKTKCIRAYIKDHPPKKKKPQETYQNIILKHFRRSITTSISLSDILTIIFNKDFVDWILSIPRLVFIRDRYYRNDDDSDIMFHWAYLLPVNLTLLVPHFIFKTDSFRRIKQLLFLFSIIFLIWAYFSTMYNQWNAIWSLSHFIGVKLLLTLHIHILIFFFLAVGGELYSIDWDCLRPFDIWYDLLNLIKNIFRFIRYLIVKVIIEMIIINTFKTIYRVIKWTMEKIWNLIIVPICKIIKIILQNIIKTMKLIRDWMMIPIYHAIIKIILNILKGIKSILTFIVNVMHGIMNLLTTIVTNINQLYKLILQYSLTFWLTFGIIGELIFTVITLSLMLSPMLIYIYYYHERWFLVCSLICSMSLMVSGYINLNEIKLKIGRK